MSLSRSFKDTVKARAARDPAFLEALHREAIEAAAAGETPSPRHALQELLAQCDPEAPISAEEQGWLDAPAVGREAI